MSTSDWLISDEFFASTTDEVGWIYYVPAPDVVEDNAEFDGLHIGRYAFDVFWDHVATNDHRYRFFPADNTFNRQVPPHTREALVAAWADYVAA
jgi:hypothetical protein